MFWQPYAIQGPLNDHLTRFERNRDPEVSLLEQKHYWMLSHKHLDRPRLDEIFECSRLGIEEAMELMLGTLRVFEERGGDYVIYRNGVVHPAIVSYNRIAGDGAPEDELKADDAGGDRIQAEEPVIMVDDDETI
jgi:hypothetical protein